MDRTIVDDGQADGLCYEVRLYPTRVAMYRAYQRRDRSLTQRAGVDIDADKDALAFTMNDHVIRFVDGKWVPLPCRGAILLQREFISTEIVAHEAAHAALSLYRHRHRGTVRSLGANLTQRENDLEEELARTIGWFTVRTLLWLRRIGVNVRGK